MTLLNILLVVALLGFVGAGHKDGFVHTLGRLIGAVFGFILAKSWSITISFIFAILLPSGWARFIAFVVIFVFVNRLVGFLFKLADGAFRVISFIPFLKTINNLLGAAIGILEGIVILGGSIWVVENFNLIPDVVALLQKSVVAQLIVKLFGFLLSFLL